jgi:hypothetical protein
MPEKLLEIRDDVQDAIQVLDGMTPHQFNIAISGQCHVPSKVVDVLLNRIVSGYAALEIYTRSGEIVDSEMALPDMIERQYLMALEKNVRHLLTSLSQTEKNKAMNDILCCISGLDNYRAKRDD